MTLPRTMDPDSLSHVPPIADAIDVIESWRNEGGEAEGEEGDGVVRKRKEERGSQGKPEGYTTTKPLIGIGS